jgi:hypothetical protein
MRSIAIERTECIGTAFERTTSGRCSISIASQTCSAFAPYRNELVAEADQLRGGDGGCRICGGSEYFSGWLPLATAYFDPELSRRDPAEVPGWLHLRAPRVSLVPRAGGRR